MIFISRIERQRKLKGILIATIELLLWMRQRPFTAWVVQLTQLLANGVQKVGILSTVCRYNGYGSRWDFIDIDNGYSFMIQFSISKWFPSAYRYSAVMYLFIILLIEFGN